MSHLLWLLRKVSLLLVMVIFASSTVHHATGQPSPLPGPAAPPGPAGVVFVQFPEDEGGVTTTLYPLGSDDNMPVLPRAVPLYSQPDPPRCQTDAVHASPNGAALLLQYNCEDTLFARLLDLNNPDAVTLLNQGYFMNWSPDGAWLLFRDIETGQVWLIPVNGGEWQPLDLPAGTYDAAFAPDGQRVLYAASVGLGFGSEMGVLNLADGRLAPWQTFPDQLVAHAAWSPDGNYLAYVLLPDTNIPFVIGELWLAEPTSGQQLTLLAEVDAGHGYAPAWSPDSASLVYVHRENPDDIQADLEPLALRSNLYQVDVYAGTVTPITQFADSLVYDAVWSPDGLLAFTADDAIWMWTPGETAVPVSPPGIYRHPAWLSAPIP